MIVLLSGVLVRLVFLIASEYLRASGQLTIHPLVPPSSTVVNGVLQINLTFSSWSTYFNLTLDFPAGALYLDTAGGSNYWAASSDFQLNLSPQSAIYQDFVRLGVGYSGTSYNGYQECIVTQNAYEVSSEITDPSSTCPDSVGLAQNTTTYTCFILAGEPREFKLQVLVLQSNNMIANVTFQPWGYTYSASYPPVQTSTLSSAVSGVSVIKNVTRTSAHPSYLYGTMWSSVPVRWCLQTRPNNYSDPGFVVPYGDFGGGANQIGINASSLQSCRSSFSNDSEGCSTEPYGSCTAVAGGLPYDQYSQFRNNLPVTLVPVDNSWQCSFVGNAWYLALGVSNLFASQFTCNYLYSYLYVNLTLNAATMDLVYGYSQISVAAAGSQTWAPRALAGTLYAVLENTGNITGQFTVSSSGCSGAGHPVITSGSSTLNVAPAATATVYFAVGISSTGSENTCNFLCTGFNIANSTTFAIVFTPANASPPPLTSTLPPPPFSHHPPYTPGVPFSMPTPPPPPAYPSLEPYSPPPPPVTSLTPYLNVTFVFSGTATYNSEFLSRFTTALSRGASIPTQNVIVLSVENSMGRRLQQAGYVVNAQVLYPSSDSLAGPSYLSSLLNSDVAIVFQSDASFYETYGPVTITATIQGFYNSQTPPRTAPLSVQDSGGSGLGWYVYAFIALTTFLLILLAWMISQHNMGGGGKLSLLARAVAARFKAWQRSKDSKSTQDSEYTQRASGNVLFEDQDAAEATAQKQAAKLYADPDSLSMLKSLISQTSASSLDGQPRTINNLVGMLKSSNQLATPDNLDRHPRAASMQTYSNLLSLLQGQDDNSENEAGFEPRAAAQLQQGLAPSAVLGPATSIAANLAPMLQSAAAASSVLDRKDYSWQEQAWIPHSSGNSQPGSKTSQGMPLMQPVLQDRSDRRQQGQLSSPNTSGPPTPRREQSALLMPAYDSQQQGALSRGREQLLQASPSRFEVERSAQTANPRLEGRTGIWQVDSVKQPYQQSVFQQVQQASATKALTSSLPFAPAPFVQSALGDDNPIRSSVVRSPGNWPK